MRRNVPIGFLFGCFWLLQTASAQDERADALAERAIQATGGAETWSKIRYLSFMFSPIRTGKNQPGPRHLWDRFTGDYRVSWVKNADTTITVLFNVQTRVGKAYFNQQPAPESAQSALLQTAYRRFINDTYWLLVPVKLFDPGVFRAYEPDSTTAGHEVLGIRFDQVGLTPGDRYWFRIDRMTGEMRTWTMRLQSNQTGIPTHYFMQQWTDFETPAGKVRLPLWKVNAQQNGIYCDRLKFPDTVPEHVFTDVKVPAWTD